MPAYDFRTLSSFDFEHLVRDLLQKALGIRLESFKKGRDKGIDLRHMIAAHGATIAQCKHYVDSGYRLLFEHLKTREVPKIKKCSPPPRFSMQRDDDVYVGHMLDLSRKVAAKIAGVPREKFEQDFGRLP